MCNPTLIASAMFASQAGSSLMSYQAQKQQAEAQDAIYQQNKLNAYQSMRDEYLGVQDRQAQEIARSSQEIIQRRQEEQAHLATARVAAGEAGINGVTVERVLQGINAAASQDVDTMAQNKEWTLEQLSDQSKGITSKTQSRVNSVRKGVKPNPWATVFGIGNAAVSAGASYTSMTK